MLSNRQPIITVSIVLYKDYERALTAIDCLFKTPLDIRLFVVDNSPTDAFKTRLEGIQFSEKVVYIYNNANIGFGAAHNIAFRNVLDSSTYHLIINPDVVFQPDVIPGLLGYMNRNPETGIVIPKVIYPSGKVQYVCRLIPSPLDLLTKRFLPSFLTERRMNKYQLAFSGYNREMQVPYFIGCFMFLRVEALWKVGLFDERFFMYPEDIDLTRRIHQHYKTMFYPTVQIVHAHEQGSYKNIKLLYIHIINMIKYFNKWGWFFDEERKKVNKKILSQFN